MKEKIGFSLDNSKFSLNLNVIQKFSKSRGRTPKWDPFEPTYDDLDDKWVILEFDILIFAEPVFGLIVEYENNCLEMESVLKMRILTMEQNVSYNFDAVKEIHILESPASSSAKEIVKEIENENLDKSIVSEIAFNSWLIKEFKNKIENSKIADLVNFLGDKIHIMDEMKDGSEAWGGRDIGHYKQIS